MTTDDMTTREAILEHLADGPKTARQLGAAILPEANIRRATSIVVLAMRGLIKSGAVRVHPGHVRTYALPASRAASPWPVKRVAVRDAIPTQSTGVSTLTHVTLRAAPWEADA